MAVTPWNTSEEHRSVAPKARWRAIALTLGSALLLNRLLSAENIWPTILVKPDHRLAPEFVLLWVTLLAMVAIGGVPGRRALGWLAGGFLLLVLGRYLDVSVPALFGREVNLYWDGLQLPRFLSVISQAISVWGLVALLVFVAAALFGLFLVLRAAIGRLARHAVPWALGSRVMLAVTAAAVVLVGANLAGVRETWPVVSKPVSPTYLRQGFILGSILLPGGIDRVLPASPPFEGDLAALNGASVKLFFLESYGAVTYDDPEIAAALAPDRERLADSVRKTGRGVVSAFYRSPTFAGASDLAHLTLLSGIDLSDPLLHDVLITTDRPTLLSHFEANGYETYGLYPALSWAWPEKRFYGYDVFVDGPALGYEGPKIGLWWIPDQYTVARFEQQRIARGSDKPHLVLMPTINTHIPFPPVLPYQPDWTRMLTKTPYDADSLDSVLADEIDWTKLRAPYVKAVRYTVDWVAGYLEQPWLGNDVLVLLGDHQPVSSVSGPGASWDVPVHVVTTDEKLLGRLRAAGFHDGLEPPRRSLGGLDRLNRDLLDAFSGSGSRQAPGGVSACTSAGPAASSSTPPAPRSAHC